MKFLLIIQLFTSKQFVIIETQIFDNYQQCQKAKTIIQSISRERSDWDLNFKPTLKSAECYKVSQ